MLFTDSQIQQIHDGALSILEEIGIKVIRPDYIDKLKKLGFLTDGSWVRIPRKRAMQQMQSTWIERGESGESQPFAVGISAYSHMWETVEGTLVSQSCDDSIRLAQFVGNASVLWPMLNPTAPGHAIDLHPDMQFLHHVKTAFQWCKGARVMEAVSCNTAPYYYEMLDVMGQSTDSVPVYTVSPLTLFGESFDIVFSHPERYKQINVTALPSLGANTPLSLVGAYAQTAAETLGAAVICEEITGVPATYKPSLYTFDFRTMSMPFGSPEKLLLEWANNEVTARLGGYPVSIKSVDIHTNAVKAGVQAVMEKGMLAVAGAMRGARGFYCIGTLAMDEVFSPVQLLLDLEMLEHLKTILDGMPVEDWNGDLIEEIRTGIEEGFISSERTLLNYKNYAWFPKMMNRYSLGAVLDRKIPDAMEKAVGLAGELFSKEPVWRLDDGKYNELEKIFRRAAESILAN